MFFLQGIADRVPITIGQNIFSLPLLRHLDRAAREVSSSFEKLSSGLRINRAVDDAAGLSVAEQLKAKGRVLNRAHLNINDGISAIDIASGTLESITTLLTRMGELAEQAASGSFGASQRRSMDQEYQALDKELRRLSETTQFNDISLLKGDFSARSATQIMSGSEVLSAISADGRYLFTESGRKDLLTGELIVAPSGFEFSGTKQSSASGEFVVSNYRDRHTLWDVRNNRVIRLNSYSSSGDYTYSAISADGSTVAFSGYGSYSANGTQTGTSADQSVYLYDIATGTYRQAAKNLGDVFGLELSASGSYGAVISSSTAAADDSFITMFKSVTSGSLQAVTLVEQLSTAQYDHGIGVTEDGKMFFASGYGAGIFSYNYNSGALAQIFDDPFIKEFEMSSDGSYLTIQSNANPVQQNSSSYYQIFKYDSITSSISQTTRYSANFLIQDGMISRDGNTLITETSGTLYQTDISPESYRLNIETGSGVAGVIQSLLGSVSGTLRGLGSQHLTTQSSARGALDNAMNNLERLGIMKGVLGASTSRLSAAGRVVRTLADEIAGARSRITDTDIAAESANLVKSQINEQAASALLGQANTIPEIALLLLNRN